MKIFWPAYFFKTLLFLCLFFACDNEESLIGENFLNDQSHEVFILPDSLINLSVSSKADLNLNASSSLNLLGSYSDPNFGITDASFCFQITLPNNEMSFDANEITNIELELPYADFYGDENTSFRIHLSTLASPINSDPETENFTSDGANFETNLSFDVYAVDLSTIQKNGALKIPLPLTFGLSEILNLSSEQLQDNNSFVAAFPGFKLEVESISNNKGDNEVGGILYLDNSSENAQLNIEYVNGDGEVESENFPISPGVQLNHFFHDYNNTNLFSEDSSDTLLFIQSMGGVFGELNFMFLDSLKDEGYIVNNAILSLSAIIDQKSSLETGQLNLCDSDNCDMVDFFPLAQSSINAENKYEFNITGYIQDVLTHNRNPICRLYMAQRNSNANRVILSNTTTNPIKLTLILIKG